MTHPTHVLDAVRRDPQLMAAVRSDVVVAVWIAALLALVGAGLGLLAAALTPHVPTVVFQDASQGYPHPIFLLAEEENRAAFGGDGVVLAVLGGAGLLAGVLAGLLGRRRPGGTVVGLFVGGCLAGVVAMAVHHAVLATTQVSLVSNGVTYSLRPFVRGPADFATLPFVALLVWFVFQLPWLLRGGDPDPNPPAVLRGAWPPPVPGTAVSWGSADSGSGPEQAPPPPS